jgi:hypothetical protein
MARLPYTFTECAIRFFIRHPDMPATIAKWLREPDIETRELGLCADLHDSLGVAVDEDNCPYSTLLAMAMTRINFRKVARFLLRHFTQPLFLLPIACAYLREPEFTGVEWN